MGSSGFLSRAQQLSPGAMDLDSDDEPDAGVKSSVNYEGEAGASKESKSEGYEGPSKPSKKKSKYDEGIYWHEPRQKWRFRITNRLTGKRTTNLYEDEDECFREYTAERAREAAAFEAEVAKRKDANPLLEGLERAPDKAEDALEKTVYYHVHKGTKPPYVPYRVVRSGKQYVRYNDTERKSKYDEGIYWDKRNQKWYFRFTNRLTGKAPYSNFYKDEDECHREYTAERAREAAAFEAEIAKQKDANPLLDGLERAPAKAEDALEKTVYYHVAKNTKPPYVPYRAVRCGKLYHVACETCNQFAQFNAKGERRFCKSHGGGGAEKCKCGRQRSVCRECNPNVTNMVCNCHSCGARLYVKRMRTHGGNGLCSMCDAHLTEQAEASGSAPPPKGKTTEDVVLDQLEPLVVDADGDIIKPEMRDDFSNVIGSLFEDVVDGGGRKLRKRKRGQEDCETTTFRRPDMLYVVREHENGRIVAALSVEVDEHSHDGRKFSCETGKVEDTYHALQKLAAGEGASRLSHTKVRADAQLIYYQVFKINTDACDVKPPIKRDERIEVLAAACREFLTRDPAEYQALSQQGECLVPHVKCFYYHSKAASEEGKVYLDEFPKLVPNWDWQGNVLRGAPKAKAVCD